MTTAATIIDTAYTLLGYKDAREAVDGQDAAYALNRLNDMIDALNTQNLYIYTTTEVVTTTSGAAITIGPGMTINTTRPIRLPPGSYARISGIDYPITWLDVHQYNSILLKSVSTTIPVYGFYDGGNPTGTLRFWPFQSVATEYHILVETQLTEFTALSTDVSLTQGYRRMLASSLAEELAPGLREPSDSLRRMAANARRAVRQANAAIPVLNFANNGTTPLARFLAGI